MKSKLQTTRVKSVFKEKLFKTMDNGIYPRSQSKKTQREHRRLYSLPLTKPRDPTSTPHLHPHLRSQYNPKPPTSGLQAPQANDMLHRAEGALPGHLRPATASAFPRKCV